MSLGTQIFGTRRFNKGFIRGIRHTAKPTISISYTPDYTRESLGYFQTVDTDIRDEFNNPLTYSIFEDGIYDKPSNAGKSMRLNYGINNNFDAKYWSKKDSTVRDFKLFNSVSVNGNYNFAADSLQWSQIQMSGTTTLFKITTFRFTAQFDPYAVNESGRRINQFNRKVNGALLRYEGSSFTFNTGITVRELRSLFSSDDGKPSRNTATRDNPNPTFNSLETTEDLLGLFENFRLNHNLNLISTPDSFYVQVNSLELTGRIQLTKNWSLDLGRTSYNFKLKQLIYPSLGFSRDLHCWTMSMNWWPERNAFAFSLRVKPGTLDFIKVPYGRNNVDGRFGGF